MSFERRKVRIGRVVSDKMDRTCVVVVEWRRPHRLYKKSVKMRTRFKVHDPQNECRLGDQIRIVETRPLSKTKRWRVEEILQREEIAEIQPEEIKVEDESVLVYQPQHPAADEVAAEGAVSEEATEEVAPAEAEEEAPVDEAEPEAAEEKAPTEAEEEAPVDEAEPEATEEKAP
ncbi:MAG: 30S ribosomal protein S17, partial [Chloroflexi bacterium]|nr:30S ribosomal protein S17 [Chloroflexota bacterium]